jgi:hypothetical protein
VYPDEAAAVVAALREHWVVRASVATVLRKARPSVKVSGVLLEHFADDVWTLARQVEMAVVSRLAEPFTSANGMLRSALERREVTKRHDRHLPTVARCLTRAMSLAGERRDVRVREELGWTVAALIALGDGAGAPQGAVQARALLLGESSAVSTRTGDDGPVPPQLPSPRTGAPARERTGGTPT